jgi:hypothetical protein
MMKRMIAVFAFVALVSAVLAASDPWKDKPFKEWTQDDVQKILNDSPWARPVTVAATWRGTTGSAITPTIGAERGSTAPRGTNDSSASADAGAQSQAQFLVRWQSALIIREAFVRSAELRGTPEDKAEQMLAAQPETYAIAVAGEDMSPFVKADEMYLKQKTYLLVKKTKQKLQPDRVELRRQPNGQRILNVMFYFTKKAANGEAVIPADEKQLEFSCELPVTKVKTTFDLAKMAGKGGPDL